jgi:ATP-dependent Lon protease
MPKNITEALDIKPVKWIDQVLEIALEHLPRPKSKTKTKTKAKQKRPEKIKKIKRVQNAKGKRSKSRN